MPTGMSPWKTDLVRVALYLLALFPTEQNKTVHLWRKGQKNSCGYRSMGNFWETDSYLNMRSL